MHSNARRSVFLLVTWRSFDSGGFALHEFVVVRVDLFLALDVGVSMLTRGGFEKIAVHSRNQDL